ncbi:hypothetical protein BKH46_09105 [Helicobacter sp. 12S02634-8]|nr:hypothetical protein BKH46_09105 [Helicobacter sp. 12S02634-8]
MWDIFLIIIKIVFFTGVFAFGMVFLALPLDDLMMKYERFNRFTHIAFVILVFLFFISITYFSILDYIQTP